MPDSNEVLPQIGLIRREELKSNTTTSAHKEVRPADISTFRLRRRTPGSFLLVPCPKQGRSIRCQGQLEGAAAVTLVACPQVLHIQEQPLAIWYTW